MFRYDLVEKAYNELRAEGIIKPCAPEEVDKQKAIMTARAAYYINQVDSNYGLLEKTSGNNVDGRSVDIIYVRGSWIEYDVATDVKYANDPSLRIASPVDSGGIPRPENASRFLTPKREWCAFPVENPIPNNPPEETPEVDLEHFASAVAVLIAAQILPQFKELNDKLAAVEAKIKPCIFRR